MSRSDSRPSGSASDPTLMAAMTIRFFSDNVPILPGSNSFILDLAWEWSCKPPFASATVPGYPPEMNGCSSVRLRMVLPLKGFMRRNREGSRPCWIFGDTTFPFRLRSIGESHLYVNDESCHDESSLQFRQ